MVSEYKRNCLRDGIHVFGDAAGNSFHPSFLSVLAYVNVLLMSNPRVMYAMAEDGVIPRLFARKQASTGVLVHSLTAFAAVCVFIIFWMKAFDKILSFTIFLDCFGMAASAGTIFKLRKQKVHPKGEEFYQMKLYSPASDCFYYCLFFCALSIALSSLTALTARSMGIFMLIYFLSVAQSLRHKAFF
jgi:APA family basic amino acid/polyamine antiporter